MKKFLYLLFFSLFATAALAQNEEDDNGNRVRQRMAEYIEKRLGLSRSEAQQFSPVYLNYLSDLRRTTQTNKTDRLVMQQKVAELRLNYRNQFKNIVGEKRSNDVFTYERDFVDEVKRIREERTMNQRDSRPNKRN